MSWSNRYRLSWDSLDRQQIEAVVQVVVKAFPVVEPDIKYSSEEHVTCYFGIPNVEAQRWEQGEIRFSGDFQIDSKQACNGLGDKLDSVWIEVRFDYFPAMPQHDMEAECSFSFDTAHSGNGMYTGIAIAITECMATYFGVVCEP
jgi:hypothetical protein